VEEGFTVKHGLSSEIVQQLKSVFAPEMKPEIFTQLWNEIDALPIVFKVDFLHFEQLENVAIKQKILNEGVVFYQASSAG
jgi:hypothetical protein